ncbi:hypothetical protein FOL47_002616 [Perkinsus chesapeaki]|uniref:Uncharacterized protein n=1 Tax=Perkinsus chesapeaki TaxID=330153 RepID=A0A7J6MCI8_PERCH|nr:hypothetical protein FOL47_002616 [Perkinsus chesapeaki]
MAFSPIIEPSVSDLKDTKGEVGPRCGPKLIVVEDEGDRHGVRPKPLCCLPIAGCCRKIGDRHEFESASDKSSLLAESSRLKPRKVADSDVAGKTPPRHSSRNKFVKIRIITDEEDIPQVTIAGLTQCVGMFDD